MPIYLDNAATSPLSPGVIELLEELNANNYANPSSIHSAGRKAAKKLKEARSFIASTINAQAEELIFTSGASESNSTVFKSFDFDLIITSAIEHASVLEAAKASRKEIYWLKTNEQGYFDYQELEKVLEKNKERKILISLMHANNEIGTIYDLERIGELAKKYQAFFHSDCVQSFAKYQIDVDKFNLDFLSSSAHKLHGPKGVGLLYVSKRAQENFQGELISGGGQELNLRSGTQNLNGILAYAKAIEESINYDHSKTRELQKQLYETLKDLPGFHLNGPSIEDRLVGNLNISFTECKLNSEELLLQLDLAGLLVSSGSACSSNKFDGQAGIISSYVLRGCGLQDIITNKAIRISISRLNSPEEIEQAGKIIQGCLNLQITG